MQKGSGRQYQTFTLARVWKVVKVTQQLHEVAAKCRHDVGRIAPCKASHHLDSQRPHHPSFIIQCNEKRSQTAQQSGCYIA